MLVSVVLCSAGFLVVAQAVFNMNQAISQLPACTVRILSSRDLPNKGSESSQDIMFGTEARRRELFRHGHAKLPLQKCYPADRGIHVCSGYL